MGFWNNIKHLFSTVKQFTYPFSRMILMTTFCRCRFAIFGINSSNSSKEGSRFLRGIFTAFLYINYSVK